MTHREQYFFSKAKHEYYAKKRKRKKDSNKVRMLPNLRKLTQAESKPNTIGYTGTVGGGVR